MRLHHTDAARVNAPSQLDTLAAPISFKTEKGKPVDYFPTPNASFDTIARDYGPYAATVYCYLLRHCDRTTGRYSADYHTIAAATGMSYSSARRAVKVLWDAAFIGVDNKNKKQRGQKPDGTPRYEQFPNVYTVAAFPKGQQSAPKERQPVPTKRLDVPTEQRTNNNLSQESTSRIKQQTRETQKSSQPDVVAVPSNINIEAQSTLMARMLAIGVDAKVAARLEATTDAKVLSEQLDCLPDRNAANPPALFKRAVEGQWEPPAKYTERTEASQRAQTERDARLREDAAKRAQSEAERQKQAIADTEAAQLDAAWAKLNPLMQKRVDAMAIEKLGPCYRPEHTGALEATRRNILREMYGQLEA